ncbi:hypothetical protein ACN4EK_25750 [Pantanalinema rosaneae CENA516]|uniref:hypothetical protein n=1 Tax=Pantanalinema rosaneae TaxID=1620701 RepID=UPI003D6E2838
MISTSDRKSSYNQPIYQSESSETAHLTSHYRLLDDRSSMTRYFNLSQSPLHLVKTTGFEISPPAKHLKQVQNT